MTTPYTKHTRRDSTTVEAILQDGAPHTRDSVQAEIGFQKLGVQEPYFHVLAGEYDRRERGYACCANHKLFAEKFPEFAHLAKWHLVSIRSGPMHYEANAIYWSEKARGVSKWDKSPGEPDPVEAFKSTVVFGAALGHDTASLDAGPMHPWLFEPEALKAWLEIRKPMLMAKFHEEIDAAFPGMWTLAEGL